MQNKSQKFCQTRETNVLLVESGFIKIEAGPELYKNLDQAGFIILNFYEVVL